MLYIRQEEKDVEEKNNEYIHIMTFIRYVRLEDSYFIRKGENEKMNKRIHIFTYI